MYLEEFTKAFIRGVGKTIGVTAVFGLAYQAYLASNEGVEKKEKRCVCACTQTEIERDYRKVFDVLSR